MNIEEKNIFDNALRKGINLFLGAGFSVLASDKIGRKLPCGHELLEELKQEFPSKAAPFSDLSKLSTVLDKSSEKLKFKGYLTNRFTVGGYCKEYDSLTRINIKNIFTTNIDNLVFKIWENASQSKKYINNTLNLGENDDELAINYFPVHGCVLNEDKEYIFSNIKIASAYSSQEGSWESLKLTVRNSSILFWGWSFNDADIIEAMYSNRGSVVDDNIKKWVVLNKPQEYEVEFYRSLNFSIIYADTRELLTYIKEHEISEYKGDKNTKRYKEYEVPSIYQEASYPVEKFFLGDAPRVCLHKLNKTS